VLVALYENATPFELRLLAPENPEILAEWAGLWPLRKMPVLADGGRTFAEASIIVEHLDRSHPGPIRLVPEDPAAALEVRFLDRVFDNFIETPLQKIVGDAMRPQDRRDRQGVAEAHAALETAYAWLDQHMQGREWAAGGGFTLADCSAAPALFYADWAHPIGESFAALRNYRSRLNARASFARAIDEARPYRPFFPLGAPDRD
jgi:glutathione S-transferase